MFYVQNWDALSSQYSAFDILKQQLSSSEKSLQSYDASKAVKRDTYLQTELLKVKDLVSEIQTNLKQLEQHPADEAAMHFLVRGKKDQLPKLKAGLNIYNHLNKMIQKKVDAIYNQFQTISQDTSDQDLKIVIESIKQMDASELDIVACRSDETAHKVLKCFADHMSTDQTDQLESIGAQIHHVDQIRALGNFSATASSLTSEIRKDLKKNTHKLYYCVFENEFFKHAKETQHPNYRGHAFVIEKTKEDQFRLYQSYDSQYSLKSFLTGQMVQHDDALMSYNDFYPFIKALKQVEQASVWNAETNEAYTQCFGVDHSSFLGQDLMPQHLQIKYYSFDLSQKDAPTQEVQKETKSQVAKSSYDYASLIKSWVISSDELYSGIKSIGVGGAIGATVSSVALSVLYAFRIIV